MHDAQTNMSIPTFAVRPPPPGYGNYDRRTSVRRSVRGRTWDIASESYGMDDIQSGDAAGVRRERWFDSEEALRVDVERETVIVIDVKDCEDQKVRVIVIKTTPNLRFITAFLIGNSTTYFTCALER